MATAVAELQDIKLTLALSPEEAERFKSMMQNEWHNHEGEVVKKLREVIWHALDDAGVASV